MNERRPLGGLSLEEAVAAIASETHGSPGAGSAAAVAMSLAAACLSKAVAITLKHDPEAAALAAARSALAEVGAAALTVATVDAQAFAAYLNEPGPASLAALLHVENHARHIRHRLARILTEVAPRIHPAMSGDVGAARALLEAAGSIVDQNRRETLAARHDRP